MDVTITGSGRWSYLAATVKCFRRSVSCSEPLRLLVTDDAGYPLEGDPCRKMIPKIGWFSSWHFTADQDYGECMGWLWDHVESDLFFHLQDDWVFTQPMNLDPLIGLMRRCSGINQIRFDKREVAAHLPPEAFRERAKRYANQAVCIEGVPLTATPKWSTQPSLNRIAFIRRFPRPTGPASYKPNRWENEWQEILIRGVDLSDLADYRAKLGVYIYGGVGFAPIIKHIGVQRALHNRVRKGNEA